MKSQGREAGREGLSVVAEGGRGGGMETQGVFGGPTPEKPRRHGHPWACVRIKGHKAGKASVCPSHDRLVTGVAVTTWPLGRSRRWSSVTMVLRGQCQPWVPPVTLCPVSHRLRRFLWASRAPHVDHCRFFSRPARKSRQRERR